MKKRWISALLAMVLTISILTGCGVDQTVPSVNSDSQQVTDPIGGDTPSQSKAARHAQKAVYNRDLSIIDYMVVNHPIMAVCIALLVLLAVISIFI